MASVWAWCVPLRFWSKWFEMARWYDRIPIETISVFIAVVSFALTFISADRNLPKIMMVAVGAAAVAAAAKLYAKKERKRD
jgi:hypothetical protein